jgi:homoserine kinase
MIKVIVPATSANLGPGFDAFGLALNIYNTFSFEEKSDGKLTIRGVERKYQGTTNLVYRAMQEVFSKVNYHPKGLSIHSDVAVPISRGLGSSATCIVAGLFGANSISGNQLSKDDLFNIAVKLEGHPDNVAPAIFGGLVVSLNDYDKNIYIKNTVHPCYDFYAFVPNFVLSTSDARNILPKKISHSDATHNIAKATITYLSFVNGLEDNLKTCMKDRLHQPYRKKLIPHYDSITRKARDFGCLNSCISGAGPTILTVVSKSNPTFSSNMANFIEEKMTDWQMLTLSPDNQGVQIIGG